jgi:DnaJ-domain-containing protein 1
MSLMGIKDRLKFIAKSYINSFLDGQERGSRPSRPAVDDEDETISADDFEKQWAAFEEEQRRWKSQEQQQRTETPHRRPGERSLEQCYKNLECPVGSDLKTVRTHFRRLMKKHHPDLHAGNKTAQEAATRISQIITESYQQLEKHLESLGQRA